MVVDTSAIIAVLMDEAAATRLADLMIKNPCALSAVSEYECRIVALARRGPAVLPEIDELLELLSVEIVPFDRQMANAALDAYARFGKGVGTPAVLNFGDCASYALAKLRDVPLLFVGDDFTRTDIQAAT
jgi:ribonuclease VapC